MTWLDVKPAVTFPTGSPISTNLLCRNMWANVSGLADSSVEIDDSVVEVFGAPSDFNLDVVVKHLNVCVVKQSFLLDDKRRSENILKQIKFVTTRNQEMNEHSLM